MNHSFVIEVRFREPSFWTLDQRLTQDMIDQALIRGFQGYEKLIEIKTRPLRKRKEKEE